MTDGDSIRTAVRDSILTNVSAGLDADAVRGVEDAGISSTEAACLSGHNLLNFEEYREVTL